MIHGWLRSFGAWKMIFHHGKFAFFDLGGCPHRESILPEYKANRGRTSGRVLEQLWVKNFVALGYGVGQSTGREADDLIAAKVKELSG